jgi:hypothetical protein
MRIFLLAFFLVMMGCTPKDTPPVGCAVPELPAGAGAVGEAAAAVLAALAAALARAASSLAFSRRSTAWLRK